MEDSDPTVASTSSVRTHCRSPELHAGRLDLLDFRGLCTLFPGAQGILEGSLAQDEGLWPEYSHHVSVCPCLQQAWLPGGCLGLKCKSAIPADGCEKM